jgi:hypothetical protein
MLRPKHLDVWSHRVLFCSELTREHNCVQITSERLVTRAQSDRR